MLWPQRPDNWRNGARPAQRTFANVAKSIAKFEHVTMGVSDDQYLNARHLLPPEVEVVELSTNDAWVRDCGPTFVKNDEGELRGVDWQFNAWGGLVDGLYFPWDKDDRVARRSPNWRRSTGIDWLTSFWKAGQSTLMAKHLDHDRGVSALKGSQSGIV